MLTNKHIGNRNKHFNNIRNISIHFFITLLLGSSIILYTQNLTFANEEDENNKKCIIYKNGELMYNPDNPNIHCNTLQILDNYWEEESLNIPQESTPLEKFADILNEDEIVANGKTVCKNPSASNATFSKNSALEDTVITGQSNQN